MKSWNTFFWEYKRFSTLLMFILPNKTNFAIDLIPGLRFTINTYEVGIAISWLTASIEFNYTIKEQKNNNLNG